MQKLKYVMRRHGIDKNGEPYDFTEVSDGISSFLLTNADGVGRQMEILELKRGDEFNAVINVETKMGQLRGTIMSVEE